MSVERLFKIVLFVTPMLIAALLVWALASVPTTPAPRPLVFGVSCGPQPISDTGNGWWWCQVFHKEWLDDGVQRQIEEPNPEVIEA